MAKSELRNRTWLIGWFFVATGLLALVGLLVGWSIAIVLEVALVLLLLPATVLRCVLNRPNSVQRSLSVLSGLILVCGWLWLATHPLAFWFLTLGWGSEPFDTVAWKAAPRLADDPDGEHNPRGAMSRSLLGHHRLQGMTKTEVIALLGYPDPPSGQSPSTAAQGQQWDYYLGWYSGFRMDPDFLSVTFGRDERVTEWWIWQS